MIGGFFARRNLRRGRGDAKGGLRFAGVLAFGGIVYSLLNYRLVPRPEYISIEFMGLAIPLFSRFSLGLGIWPWNRTREESGPS
jgi:hypothetical protein